MVHSAMKAHTTGSHPAEPQDAKPPQIRSVDFVEMKDAQKHGEQRYDMGVLTGAIIATGVTSNRPVTFRNIMFEMGIGALVGVGAIVAGRAIDYLLKSKPEPVKGDVIHAVVQEAPADWVERAGKPDHPHEHGR